MDRRRKEGDMRIALIMAGLALALPAVAAAETADRRALREAANQRVLHANYPRASLKAGEEGDVAFRVELEQGGSLHSCVVTRSSGYLRLDAATCELIVATARFKPVRDARGRVVPSVHEGSLAWRLPPGHAPAAPLPRNAALVSAAELADGKLICRRMPKAGSIYLKQKLCLTADDWVRARANAERETLRLQNPGVF
jgi:TonB family protein